MGAGVTSLGLGAVQESIAAGESVGSRGGLGSSLKAFGECLQLREWWHNPSAGPCGSWGSGVGPSAILEMMAVPERAGSAPHNV